MQELESKSNEVKNQEPLPEPLPLQGFRKPSLAEAKATHEMLEGFREGVKEGNYQGKHLVHIAMGLQFLDNMVNQSRGQLDLAKLKAKKESEKLNVVS